MNTTFSEIDERNTDLLAQIAVDSKEMILDTGKELFFQMSASFRYLDQSIS